MTEHAAATKLGINVSPVAVSRFADGEISVKIEENVRGCDVYIIQPTSAPANEHLMELLLMIRCAPSASRLLLFQFCAAP